MLRRQSPEIALPRLVLALLRGLEGRGTLGVRRHCDHGRTPVWGFARVGLTLELVESLLQRGKLRLVSERLRHRTVDRPRNPCVDRSHKSRTERQRRPRNLLENHGSPVPHSRIRVADRESLEIGLELVGRLGRLRGLCTVVEVEQRLCVPPNRRIAIIASEFLVPTPLLRTQTRAAVRTGRARGWAAAESRGPPPSIRCALASSGRARSPCALLSEVRLDYVPNLAGPRPIGVRRLAPKPLGQVDRQPREDANGLSGRVLVRAHVVQLSRRS